MAPWDLERRAGICTWRVSGAGPLRRQGALWRRRAAVRLGSLGALPPLRRSHLTPALPRAWGLQVAVTVSPPPLGSSGDPRSRGFSSSRSGCNLEGTWYRPGGGALLGNPSWRPGPDPLPLFRSVLFLHGPANLAALPRSPSPALGAHLAAAQASLQPIVTKLDLERRRSLRAPAEGRAASRRKQPAAAGSDSTTYLRQGKRVSGQAAP